MKIKSPDSPHFCPFLEKLVHFPLFISFSHESDWSFSLRIHLLALRPSLSFALMSYSVLIHMAILAFHKKERFSMNFHGLFLRTKIKAQKCPATIFKAQGLLREEALYLFLSYTKYRNYYQATFKSILIRKPYSPSLTS